MADEQKRIIGLTETEEIGTGDYIAMDSEGGGTKKIKASHFTGGSGNVMWGGIQGDIADQTDLAEELDGLREDVDNKANIDGYYEDLTAGSSEQLLSNTYIPDNTPYLFRTSGGSLEIGDRVYEDAIVGGSVAWNQITQNGDFSDGTNNWVSENATFTSLSVANNTLSVSVIQKPNYFYDIGMIQSAYYDVIANHKMLFSIDAKLPHASSLLLRGNLLGGSGQVVMGSNLAENVWTKCQRIINVNDTVRSKPYYAPVQDVIADYNVGDVIQYRNVMVTDLTLMFGSTIADYAYTLEQTERGSGIAWLKSQGFFTKDYYAYNAGGIQSVKTSAKKVVGFNQWDEQWELGQYDASTGEKSEITDRIRSKNAIAVLPNTQYYFRITTIKYVYYYDINNNYIGRYIMNASSGYNYFTTPSNCWFVRFNLISTYGTTYNHDICINFHWDGERDGEYEPYVEHTYPLDSDLELRGIPKLDSSNKLYYDGDLYASDGTVTRRYGIVDLGTLDWMKESNHFYSSRLSNAVTISDNTIIYNAINSKYIVLAQQTVANEAQDKSLGIANNRRVYLYDSTYSESTDTQFKTAMSGQYLVYELATPTSESADPYTNPQIVSNWGTEQFVDERDVPVPVGHNSRYLPDLKAKLESAPNNPNTNGKYFLQYQDGEAIYVPVPSEVPQTPSEDGTYVLKATVASGVATLAWVPET